MMKFAVNPSLRPAGSDEAVAEAEAGCAAWREERARQLRPPAVKELVNLSLSPTGGRFVPEHFLVLDSDLPLAPLEEPGWTDPAGAGVVRANATPLRLGVGGDATTLPKGGARETWWTSVMGNRDLLQLQAPRPADAPGQAVFAGALLTAKVSDLFAMAPCREGQIAHRTVRGGDNKNNAFRALLDGNQYELPQSDGSVRTLSLAVRPAPPRIVRSELPRGELIVTADGVSGQRRTHRLRTHWVDPTQSNWMSAVIFALRSGWLADGKARLQPAIMCHDGASYSGLMATVLHGMQCLEDFNRGWLTLRDAKDLARELERFIAQGGERRGPEFAAVDGQPVDVARLAQEIWTTWGAMNSAPDTLSVSTRRREPPFGAAGDRPGSIRSADSGFVSPSADPEVQFNFRQSRAMTPVAEVDESSPVAGSSPKPLDERLREAGVGRAIADLLREAGSPSLTTDLDAEYEWFVDEAGTQLGLAALRLSPEDIAGSERVQSEALPAFLETLRAAVTPLFAQVLAEGGDKLRRAAETLARRLEEDPRQRSILERRVNDRVKSGTEQAQGSGLLRAALSLVVLDVAARGSPKILPLPLQGARRRLDLSLPSDLNRTLETASATPPPAAAGSPVLGSARAQLLRGSLPDDLDVERLSRGRDSWGLSDLRSLLGSPGAASITGSTASLNTPGRHGSVARAVKHLQACERAATSEARQEAESYADIQQSWRPGGDSYERFAPKLDGLVREMTGVTGWRGYVRARMNSAERRALTPHLSWGAAVAEQVHQQLVTRDNGQTDAQPDPLPRAALVRGAIRDLLQARFDALTPQQQAHWRTRVEGASPRYAHAMSESDAEVRSLPTRLDPGGSVVGLDQRQRVDAMPAPVVGLNRMPPAAARKLVDKTWAPHWVLTLMREVAARR